MGIRCAKAVIGANLGDEGKGLVTDYLAHDVIRKGLTCLVVCNNGGAQRSHTVVLENGARHAFRHFGSGTFAGADTYLSEYFILNPIIFRIEYEELRKLGYEPFVYIDEHCRMSTPYEMYLNQMLEQSRVNRHGSCGLGIWETVQRYEENDLGRYGDRYTCKSLIDAELFNRNIIFESKLNQYLATGAISREVLNKWESVIKDESIITRFASDIEFMLRHSVITDASIINAYDAVIFENGQGLLLNEDENNVHTTPSKTGMGNIIAIEKQLGNSFVTEPYYVTRSYMTRHGAGELAFECSKQELGNLGIDKNNLPNNFQGALRYATLDSGITNRIRGDTRNRKASVIITHMNERHIRKDEMVIDQLESLDSIDILASYNETRNGITNI